MDSSGPARDYRDPGELHLIDEFTVLGTGATFASPTTDNLGTVDSFLPPISDTLNPQDFSSAVKLYQFHLPSGPSVWQVGISVAAHSIGSDLPSALALFDSAGNVIATSNSGSGIPTDPDDPYIITGLQPNQTYYIGVSGANNLPNSVVSNGYDPIFGDPGDAGIPQPGGPFDFQLNLAVSPHNQPTH